MKDKGITYGKNRKSDNEKYVESVTDKEELSKVIELFK